MTALRSAARLRAQVSRAVLLLGCPGLLMAQGARSAVADTTTLPTGPRAGSTACVVTRISDGDSIRCRTALGEERVRLTGIDAPELAQEPFGPGSRAALAGMIARGDTVSLESDVRQRDQHGRRLAYVWRGDEMINLAMVRQGWALPYTVPPNVRYESRFRSAGRDARAARVGHWREDGFTCPPEQFRRGKCGR